MSRETACLISALMSTPPSGKPGIARPAPVVLPEYIPLAFMFIYAPWPRLPSFGRLKNYG